MNLSCGIVGLPNVGKTTIFNAITASAAAAENYPFCTIEPNIGIVPIPDPRLAILTRFIDSQETIPATLKMVDIAGLVEGASHGEGLGNKFLGNIKDVHAIAHIVRCFSAASVVHTSETIDPIRDIEIVELELALADLDTLDRNIERVAKTARSGDKTSAADQALFERAQEALNQNQSLRCLPWTEHERETLRPLFLLTMKPVLFVANVDEDDIDGHSPAATAVRDHAASTSSQSIALCGDIEGEIAQLEPDDRALFLDDLNLTEPGLDRLVRQTQELLGLQTFFTANSQAIRAWNIRRGDTAPTAAGAVHTDFEKGFIRAEVYNVSELEEHESETAIKAAGKMRVEGRDYVMQEGDVAFFLIGGGSGR